MRPSVTGVLRRFIPAFLAGEPVLHEAQHRALWAITHCRTPTMGGHLYACGTCSESRFAYHSCNHRSCPQCGRSATAEWVARELDKRINAPYFMVTFTLPSELRGLFFGRGARKAYSAFFSASAGALAEKLAVPRNLGAQKSGFTGVLHTWNQQLGFHPHIHYIVPGAGLGASGQLVRVKSEQFLVYFELLGRAFRSHFGEQLRKLGWEVDPDVWKKDWGVHIKASGTGENAIKYLGTYVCRTAIADSRIVSANDKTVTFRWKDRSRGNAQRISTVSGKEFVARYLHHVLPRGMRAVRYYGFCHPAAKKTRERVRFLAGGQLAIGAVTAPAPKENGVPHCPCCQLPMRKVCSLPRAWSRGPPETTP